MQDLTISLIQSPLIWENPEANRQYFQKLIEAYEDKSDVFVLPEMFTTGFTMKEEVTETYSENSETVDWMKKLAIKKKAAICGSVIMTEDGKRRNRFLWVDADQIVYYDKRHLWSYGDEHKHFKAGLDRVIIEYKGWRVLPQVCYDLRFPVFARNSWDGKRADFDLMIYVANWPDARVHAWDTLAAARATENQCYVAAVNRIGRDDKNLNYVGHSALVASNGEHIIHPIHEAEGVFSSLIEYEKLIRFRERFPILKDADQFEIKDESRPGSKS